MAEEKEFLEVFEDKKAYIDKEIKEIVNERIPPSLKDLMKKDLRILTIDERVSAMRKMVEDSGLREEQIAGNSWGFPLIPIPSERTISGITRMAPSNIDRSFLGHPIFWLSPEVTRRRSGEEIDNWGIRMFVLLSCLGYYTSEGWVDFISANGVTLSEQDFLGYKTTNNQPTTMDSEEYRDAFHLRTMEDIGPELLDEVERRTQNILTICEETLIREIDYFSKRQSEVFFMAKVIIGDDPISMVTQPDSVKSQWSRSFFPSVEEVSLMFEKELEEPSPTLTPIMNIAMERFSKVEDFIKLIESITAILTVPVMNVQVGQETTSEAFSKMVSQLSVSGRKSIETARDVDFSDDIRHAFILNRSSGDVDKIIRACYERYFEAWKRMRIAVINIILISQGDKPISNYRELESILLEVANERMGDTGSTFTEDTIKNAEIISESIDPEDKSYRAIIHDEEYVNEFDENFDSIVDEIDSSELSAPAPSVRRTRKTAKAKPRRAPVKKATKRAPAKKVAKKSSSSAKKRGGAKKKPKSKGWF